MLIIQEWNVQGDPNQKLQFQMAVTLAIGILIWPTIGKAKMCFRSGGFFSVFSCLFTISKTIPPLLKPILVFTTKGLGCIVMEI